jgi:hypothetical protein
MYNHNVIHQACCAIIEAALFVVLPASASVARVLQSAYGVDPPETRLHENGPFIKAVDFVRLKIIDGMGDLREGKKIRAVLSKGKDVLMMERPKH